MKKTIFTVAMLALVSCGESHEDKIKRLEKEQTDLFVLESKLRLEYYDTTPSDSLSEVISKRNKQIRKDLDQLDNPSRGYSWQSGMDAIEDLIAENDKDLKQQTKIENDFIYYKNADSLKTAYANKQFEINRLIKEIQTK